MATIITYPGGEIYPTLISGYESSRTSNNREHRVPGRANSDFTLRPAGLRSGTLELVFATNAGTTEYVIDEDGYVVPVDIPGATAEAASKACEDAHAAGQVLTLATAERDSILMTYVVRENGDITRRLDPQTRAVWIVTVDYQEILP